MNASRIAPLLHHIVRLAILLGLTAYVAYLSATGQILLFIAPQLVKYADLAAGCMALFMLGQLYLLIRSFRAPAAACDCGHSHGHDDHGHSHEPAGGPVKNGLVYGLFVLPLLLGLLLPNEAFAGSLAHNKGMNLGVFSGGGMPADLARLDGTEDPDLKQLFRSDTYDRDYAKLGMLLYKQDTIAMSDEWFIEKLQAMNTFADNFQGKKLQIRGFVYREEGLAANQLIIGRMAMTHCIADISPYGIIAEADNAGGYANDSWVTLTGTLATATFHEQKVVKLTIESAEPASAPEIPYVYPDWDFGKKLK
ncbi:TIGR03943 family protein [Paenibacillus sp. UNC496MF]|uniref:TIGR03943 family putative permease subunit n=1 Tax=Paenibacillus sp. UNC496MF TaxID=1502753 RepID=UPI0008E1621B|nr:TIGR03943 family protein [Paenibacillus sp. UNC496MF]SFJ83507.1 TIGR03943 family protein [Paenibacillus sp. UNC496MF]